MITRVGRAVQGCIRLMAYEIRSIANGGRPGTMKNIADLSNEIADIQQYLDADESQIESIASYLSHSCLRINVDYENIFRHHPEFGVQSQSAS